MLPSQSGELLTLLMVPPLHMRLVIQSNIMLLVPELEVLCTPPDVSALLIVSRACEVNVLSMVSGLSVHESNGSTRTDRLPLQLAFVLFKDWAQLPVFRFHVIIIDA